MQERFRLLGEAQTPKEITDALNIRRRELGITLVELNEAVGFAGGYSAKLFAKGYRKYLGQESMPAMLSALGCRLVVVCDEQAELPAIVRRTLNEKTYGAGVVSRKTAVA
jgi:hypothetical protein